MEQNINEYLTISTQLQAETGELFQVLYSDKQLLCQFYQAL